MALEAFGFAGKRVHIELVGGKLDGAQYDTGSSDPGERALAEALRYSRWFNRVDVIEEERDVFVQLSPKQAE